MYKDDHVAAQARVEALEAELRNKRMSETEKARSLSMKLQSWSDFIQKTWFVTFLPLMTGFCLVFIFSLSSALRGCSEDKRTALQACIKYCKTQHIKDGIARVEVDASASSRDPHCECTYGVAVRK